MKIVYSVRLNAFWIPDFCSWWSFSSVWLLLPSNSWIILESSGPATIHVLKADGFSVGSTAPPSPITLAFSCPCTRCARTGNALTPRVDEITCALHAWKGRYSPHGPCTWLGYAAYVWGLPLSASASKPIRQGWRQLNDSWSPFWKALLQAKESCHELIRCGCIASCRGQCKNLKAYLACTGLCKCGGNCQQP